MTDYILRHEDYFRKVMEEQLRVESTEKLTVLKKQLARNEKRIADLKRLFMKIYEDNASGKLSDERFDMMDQPDHDQSAWRRYVRICDHSQGHRPDGDSYGRRMASLGMNSQKE